MITFVCSILACMGSDELKAFLTALSGRDMKIRIAEFLQQEDCIAEAMDIAVGESGSEAFRAAWGISAIYETNRLCFLRYKDKFVSDFCRVTFSILKFLSRWIEWGEDMLQQLEALCETDMSPGMRALMRRLRK